MRNIAIIIALFIIFLYSIIYNKASYYYLDEAYKNHIQESLDRDSIIIDKLNRIHLELAVNSEILKILASNTKLMTLYDERIPDISSQTASMDQEIK